MLQDEIMGESTTPVQPHHGGLKALQEPQDVQWLLEIESSVRVQQLSLPQVDDLVELLGRAQFISTLDLTKGYCQVALVPQIQNQNSFQHCFRPLAVPGSSL